MNALIAENTWQVNAPASSLAEISSWLGPWALDDASGHTGIISFSHADLPHKNLIESTSTGFHVELDQLSINADWASSPPRVSIVHTPGSAILAARTACRLIAIKSTLETGGMVLHASSVKLSGGLVLFAGPSGTGKTTAATTFPQTDLVDDDTVPLIPAGESWRRPDTFNFDTPSLFPPGTAALPILAVILPSPGESFHLDRLAPADAVMACMHLPPPLLLPGGKPAPTNLHNTLETTSAFTHTTPVYRMTWRLGDPLPELIGATL